MATKIQRWGNSHGLRVPKEVMEAAHRVVGDAVDVRAVDGTLVVTPLRRVRGRLGLADLVAALPRDSTHAEVPWGELFAAFAAHVADVRRGAARRCGVAEGLMTTFA